MRPIRDRSSTITWQECCPTSKPKSSGAPIRPKDSSYCPGAGSLNAPSPGSTAVEDLPRTGRTSIARASHSCALPQSASCCENSVIPLDVLGQTLRPISISYTVSNYQESHCRIEYSKPQKSTVFLVVFDQICFVIFSYLT